MEELQEELTIDILSRLPVKTIIQCKCVCKKWRNLVLESSFVNLHLSKSPTGLIVHLNPHIDNIDNWADSKNPGILKWVEIEDKVDHHHLHHDPLMTLNLNLAPILQNSRIEQMGSVNGLICLWQHSYNLDNTYICNPITREYMILPRQQYYSKRFVMPFYGFGLSSVTGEYKVVRILRLDIPSNEPRVLESEVYTLGTGKWRSLGRVPYWLNGLYELYGPFLNNHCHWIYKDAKICSFDLNKEIFQLFPSPPSNKPIQGSRFCRQSLAVLKGCLCKLETYDSDVTIWVMKEYGIEKSWHKEVVIQQGVGVTWLPTQLIYLIEGLKDGSILMVSRNNKLWAYCPQSNTIEEAEILDGCISGLTYRPSFFKLKNFDSERVYMF